MRNLSKANAKGTELANQISTLPAAVTRQRFRALLCNTPLLHSLSLAVCSSDSATANRLSANQIRTETVPGLNYFHRNASRVKRATQDMPNEKLCSEQEMGEASIAALSKAGITALVERLSGLKPTLIALEATGNQRARKRRWESDHVSRTS